jgi:hypothetical protein
MTTHKGPFRFDGPLGKRGRQEKSTKTNTATNEKPKGGFNGERTRTEARYELTRQSRESLAHCSKLSKVIGDALADYFYCIRDRYAHGRLNGLFMQIRSCDPHHDGMKQLRRGLATDAGRALLLLHNFQKERKLGANVRRPFTADLAQGRLTLPHFTPAIDHTFPKGTKMAGLQLLLLRIDLDTLCCALAVSDVKIFTDTDAACSDVVLEAPIPDGKGHLFALLFSCYCFMERGTLRWTPRQETTLAFVGINTNA